MPRRGRSVPGSPVGDARHFATKHGYRIDVNQETVAQAAANVGSGLLSGIPVSTSLSATSLNDSAGAKTGLASLATGAAILPTLLLLAAVLHPAQGGAGGGDHRRRAVRHGDGGLFFVTADALGDRIRDAALAADPPLRAVVLDYQGID